MPWVTPRTWAATDVPTAAQFNQDLRDNLAHLKGVATEGRVGFSVRDEVMPVTFQTTTSPTWDVFDWNQYGLANAGQMIQYVVPGLYIVHAQARLNLDGFLALMLLTSSGYFSSAGADTAYTVSHGGDGAAYSERNARALWKTDGTKALGLHVWHACNAATAYLDWVRLAAQGIR